MIRRLESTKNAQVRRVAALQNTARARSENVFCLEGMRSVAELCMPWEAESLWISDSFAERNPGYISALKSGQPEAWRKVQEYQVPDTVFAKIADTVNPQGIMAVVRRHTFRREDLLSETPFWIVLENLQDPGNAGTILRTADACGVTGILCTRGTVDFYNSKVVRAAMGSLLHIPFVTMNHIQDIAQFVREQRGALIGTHLQARVQHYDVSYEGPSAILIGNEGAGITEEAAALCSHLVKIPMPGRAESLNAGVAAAVMMYEVIRQRSVSLK